jgi:hypothetical protein
MNVIFFDDSINSMENKILISRIRIELPNVTLFPAYSLKFFEDKIKRIFVHTIILDIMAAETNIRSFRTNKRVRSARLGIELLERVRGGYYPKQDSKIPIIMRTARADDDKVISECEQYEANLICLPGSDDSRIIEYLNELANK